jgi:hypothetical protein
MSHTGGRFLVVNQPMRELTYAINPLNAELNPICHLLALLGARRILHISRIRVNVLQAGVEVWFHSTARDTTRP